MTDTADIEAGLGIDYSKEEIDALLGAEAKKIKPVQAEITIKDLFQVKGITPYIVRSINRANAYTQKFSNTQSLLEIRSSVQGLDQLETVINLLMGDERDAIVAKLDDRTPYIMEYVKVVLKRSALGN